MNDIWFTSDTHFWHKNVIKYTRPQFSDVQEMNETLISNWNSVVKKEDLVYFLGDFSFCGTQKTIDILDRLNGQIHLIIGNHDRRMTNSVKSKFVWAKDLGILKVDRPLYKGIIELCHFPFLSWASSYHGRYHFFGHTHGTLETRMLSLDVGVEKWNYFPVHLDILLQEMLKKKERLKLIKENEVNMDMDKIKESITRAVSKKVKEHFENISCEEYEKMYADIFAEVFKEVSEEVTKKMLTPKSEDEKKD